MIRFRPPLAVVPAMLIALAWIAVEASAQNSSLLYAPRPTVPQMHMPSGAAAPPFAPAPPVSIAAPSRTDAEPLGTGSRYDGVEGPITQTGYAGRPPIMLDGVSWTYQPSPPMRVFRKNDVVTIRVDEITRVMAEGSAESRKRTLYEAVLTDWIKLTDFRLRPDPQSNGDPSVATESNNNYRAQSSVESRESMTFNIAANVVDIRPNGSLVLEARKTIRVNDNLWETSLTGICRAQDIAPDNVVLSKDLIDLEIRKHDQGHLRDGYKRGWFQRWFDRVQPF